MEEEHFVIVLPIFVRNELKMDNHVLKMKICAIHQQAVWKLMDEMLYALNIFQSKAQKLIFLILVSGHKMKNGSALQGIIIQNKYAMKLH